MYFWLICKRYAFIHQLRYDYVNATNAKNNYVQRSPLPLKVNYLSNKEKECCHERYSWIRKAQCTFSVYFHLWNLCMIALEICDVHLSITNQTWSRHMSTSKRQNAFGKYLLLYQNYMTRSNLNNQYDMYSWKTIAKPYLYSLIKYIFLDTVSGTIHLAAETIQTTRLYAWTIYDLKSMIKNVYNGFNATIHKYWIQININMNIICKHWIPIYGYRRMMFTYVCTIS